MDFNTGGSGGAPQQSRVSSGGTGVEFSLSDPVGSFVATVRAVVLTPVAFFGGIRKNGDFVGPIVFALICSVVSGLLGAVISLLSGLLFGSSTGSAVGGFFTTLILTPLGTLVGLFIGAAIYHLVVMLLVKPNAGFEGSFRVVAYANVVQLVAWIPILGLILAIYSIFLAVIGMREVHGTSTGRAVAVVLIPTAVLLGVIVIFAVIIGIIIAAAVGGGAA